MTRERVIIDTDPGVDDAGAILLALASPELEVAALTAVAGNVPLEAAVANAGKVVALAGWPDLPILAGSPGPLVRDQVFGKHRGLGAFSDDLFPERPDPTAPGHAVTFIVQEAQAAAAAGRTLSVCALGPLTNVALALAHDPSVAAGIGRIVLMGGAFAVLGNRVPWADFNLWADPHAAAIVLSSGVPLVMLPLDVTFQALMEDRHLERLRRVAGRVGSVFARLFAASDRSDPKRFGRPGGPVHDALVIAWLLQPSLFASRPAAVGVECAGTTAGHCHADFHDIGDRPPNAEVVLEVEPERVFDLLTERLARLDEASGGRAA